MADEHPYSPGRSDQGRWASCLDHLTFNTSRLRARVFFVDPAVVTVEGDVDPSTFPALCRALDVAAGDGRRDVDVDMSATRSISAAGLRQMLLVSEQLTASGHRLRVASVSQAVADLVTDTLSAEQHAVPAGASDAIAPPPGRADASHYAPVYALRAATDRAGEVGRSDSVENSPATTRRERESLSVPRARHRVGGATRSKGNAAAPGAFRAPPTGLAVLEQRAIYEFWSFLACYPLFHMMGRGDGHAVMVLPPFAADDSYMRPLRSVLRAQGFVVHGWQMGANLSRTPKIVERLPRRLLELHERHGSKLSLVGHSGGGNWARELAREYPFAVRQVITLGCPFRLRPGDPTQADPLADILLADQVPHDPSALMEEELRPPLTVPVTSIYTRTDGVATWHAGIEAQGPLRENIEVIGSHCGLAYNPAAVIAVADRLRQREGAWRPFRPPAFARHLFPPPTYWRRSPSAAAA